MASLCEAGLFVGVNGYAGLRADRQLLNAVEDAKWLADYFRATQVTPDGHWVHLAGPDRLGILRGAAALAARVEPEGTGVFHFAGHAEYGPEGLVLASSDFDPELPADTGTPLRRLFQLFKEAGDTGRTFLVVLDCCRVGQGPRVVTDDIPQNVCVLYSCRAGGVAVEGNGGGLLTQAILRVLADHARKAGDHIPFTLRRLYTRLRAHLVARLTAPNPTYELFGGHVDRIRLPVLGSTTAGPAATAGRPTCHLVTATGPAPDDLRRRLSRFLATWFEAAGNRGRADELARRYLKVDERKGRLSLRLPDDTQFWAAREFAEQLLELFYNDFLTLTVRWRSLIKDDYFKALSSTFAILTRLKWPCFLGFLPVWQRLFEHPPAKRGLR